MPTDVRSLGFGGDLATTIYNSHAPRNVDPFVTLSPLREDQGLQGSNDYLTSILNASLEDLRRGTGSSTPGSPLLFRLLRHGALLEYLRVNAVLRETRGAAPDDAARTAARYREPEMLGPERELEESPWDALDKPFNVKDLLWLDPNYTLPDPSRRATREIVKAELGPLSDALLALKECPTAELERLLTETLDTCSHRLDAWVTSVFTKRLHAMRANVGEGCHVGAYAWVENLSARGATPVSDGYIHGPSLDHAATGAILRNAFTTHDDARFAVDLSSSRVRAAQSILDPVRAGQSLGAVLGIRVERALHDGRLDQYIDPLRQRFPLVANKGANSGLPADEVAARNVVDGLALYRNFDSLRAAGIPSREHEGAFQALREDLARAIDAVSDLLTAESVFQLVRGNTTVAGATLDSVARGQRPPDPEVARSPRSGIAVAHRVALAFAPRTNTRPYWDTVSERSTLEPTLDDWVGRVLGDPGDVVCTVTWTLPLLSNRSEVLSTRPLEVTLRDLGLTPLDVLALSRETPTGWEAVVPPGAPARALPPAPATAIDLRILDRAMTALREIPGAKVRAILHTPASRPGTRTFPELWEVARALDDVLQNARPMRRDDFLPPSQGRSTTGEPVPDEELTARLRTTACRFAECCAALENAAAPQDLVRTNLTRAAEFGVVGAFPAPASFAEGTEAALREKARSVAREMRQRLARAADRAAPGEVSATTLRDEALARIPQHARDVATAFFGAAPLMLFTFSLDRNTALRVRGAFAPRSAPRGADAPAVRRWFHQVACVRPALGRWRKLALYLAMIPPFAPESSETEPVLPRMPSFQVAQFAPASYPHWIALPTPTERDGMGTVRPVLPPAGTTSFAVHLPDGPPDETWTTWAGLMLDEWVELIPNRRELTGIAFHYDDPGAEAAQAVLVAVPPVEGVPWTADLLVETLTETLELAKLRAVDGERLGPLTHFLPAIHLANNTEGETVSTDFTGHLITDRPQPPRS